MYQTIDDVIMSLGVFKTHVNELYESNEKHNAEKHDLKLKIETMTLQNQEIEHQLKITSDTLKELTDEIEALKKVSHIIAIERENNKLRTELNKLKMNHNVKKYTPDIIPDIINAPNLFPVENSVLDTIQETSVNELEEDFSVFEKTFNKKIYYISDDDHMIIYNKNSDNSIGERLGKCNKHGTKLVPSWD
jgi:chromosome segregation ATPase